MLATALAIVLLVIRPTRTAGGAVEQLPLVDGDEQLAA
jgi:hypothetical protein